jgi:uncharacterized protein (TIGR02147 family)
MQASPLGRLRDRVQKCPPDRPRHQPNSLNPQESRSTIKFKALAADKTFTGAKGARNFAAPPAPEQVRMNGSKKRLRELAASVDVTQYLNHRAYLAEVYRVLKASLEGYTYLVFADDLGFSKTNVMRLVIVGQRPLTPKAAQRVAAALGLKSGARRYFETLVEYAHERLPARRDELFAELLTLKARSEAPSLPAPLADYFGAWYHPVIREMTALADFDGDAEWIKQRLAFPLRLDEIKRSLELLAELGYIAYDARAGRYVRVGATIVTEAEIDSLAVVRYHQKMIEMGREAITTVAEEERDVRAVTVTLPRRAVALLKGRIEEWVKEIAALESPEAPGEEVIQVNVQMFPFTKAVKGGGAS